MPTFDDNLIGKRVEVLTKFDGYEDLYWNRGVIDAVSKLGMDGRQRRYGWIYIVYEREDKETWFNANRPSYFNGSKANSWRFVMDLEPFVDVEDYPERPQAEPIDEDDDS